MTTATTTKPRDTVKTRFLVISDTHAVDLHQNDTQFPFKAPMPAADVLLHCGDLTELGGQSEYDVTLNMLSRIDAELKLVIAGNHDITLDDKYYRKNGPYLDGPSFDLANTQKAKEKWTGAAAKRAGVKYLEEGLNTFELKNGAKFTIYTSPYQPEFCNFAFPYEKYEDRFNPSTLTHPNAQSIVQNPIPDFPAIDILMTHGPPHTILDKTGHGQNVGCPHLLKAARRARPQLYCFGHIHEGWGAERVQWDLSKEVEADGTAKEFIASKLRLPRNDLKGHDEGKRSEPVRTDFDGNPLPQRIDRVQHVDVSQESERPLTVGEETLMVNTAIMTIRQKPHQAPWVVDLDLPRATGTKL